MTTPDRRPVILSLGAGVQSSTLALMAAAGEIGPMPVAAIFADTGEEPAAVYKWLGWLKAQLPFPVAITKLGDLGRDSVKLRTVQKASSPNFGGTYLKPAIPAFLLGREGVSIMGRQCTLTYKIEPVRRASRKIMHELGAKEATMWIGISTDEAHRMKPSRDPRFISEWPLIDHGISRGDCLRWVRNKYGLTPPRSSCVFCPYHSDAEWIRIKTDDPEAFSEACRYERQLSMAVRDSTILKADAAFLHRSCVPLDKVPFDGAKQTNLFGNECEGMCGV